MSYASILLAQAPTKTSPYAVGITAGVATSIRGPDNNDVGDGWSVGLIGERQLPGALALRAELSHVSFGAQRWYGIETPGGWFDASITFATIDARLDLFTDATGSRRRRSVSPHFLFGPGYYRVSRSGYCSGVCETATQVRYRLGLNGGAGAALPLTAFTPSIDIQYHRLFEERGSSESSVGTWKLAVSFTR